MFPSPVDCPEGLAARGRIFGRRESGRHLVHGQDMHDQWFDYETGSQGRGWLHPFRHSPGDGGQSGRKAGVLKDLLHRLY